MERPADLMEGHPFFRPDGPLALFLAAEARKFETYQEKQDFYLNVAIRAALASAAYRHAADEGVPSQLVVRTSQEIEQVLRAMAFTAGHIESILTALAQTRGYDGFIEALNKGLFTGPGH